MSTLSSLSKIGEALAVWLNPERREKAILRSAIEAGDELLAIKDAMIIRSNGSFKASRKDVGRYQAFSDKQLLEYEEHYSKRWKSWKDGQT